MQDIKNQNNNMDRPEARPEKRGFFRTIGVWCSRLFRVYDQEFLLVIHDKGLLLFFTFLPLVYPIIYSLIYNPEIVRDVAMVVVDNDRTPLSRKLVREMDACQEARVIGYAANMDEAREAMNRGDAFGILEIPEGFERKIGAGEQAPAVLYCDMALLLRYKALLVAATNVMQEMSSELMTVNIDRVAPLAETVTDGNLMPINNANLGNIKGGFDSFIMPAVIVLILQQCLILVVGMAGGAKHESPRLIHYNPENLTRSCIGTMLGQALCYITIMFLPTIFMIHYVPMIFKFPMAGNFLEILIFMLPMALASIGVGFVFQAVVTERESVFLSWVVTSLFFLFVSGAIWPRYDMPAFWRGLGAICPGTWGVEGYIKMTSNGARLWQVSSEYINLWLIALGWWVAGWCAQKFVVHPEIHKMMNLRRNLICYFNNTHPTPDNNSNIQTNETEGQA